MFKYSLLILITIIIAAFIFIAFGLKFKFDRANKYTLLITLIAMLIFDTYLTALPIVMYNVALTLNVRIITFPIEDLGYLIIAAILLPLLFEKLSNEKRSHTKQTKP